MKYREAIELAENFFLVKPELKQKPVILMYLLSSSP